MCRSSVLLPTLTRKLGTMANAAINVRVRLFVFLLAALHHSGPARGCREDQFRCADRGCVQAYNKCDGYDDCGDGSDETTGWQSNRLFSARKMTRKTARKSNLLEAYVYI